MVSIIIPSRNEQFLVPTVEDLLRKAKGDIEIIIILDGYWEQNLPNDKRVKVLHRGKARGMRDGINSAVAMSKGEYIMKSDAHCMFDEGFDEKLKEMKDNWIVIPRRKRLDAENWKILDVGKPDVDYEFIYHPKHHDMGIKGQVWNERAIERKDVLIDENMTFQGSCYFMTRKHWDRIGGLDPKGYGQFVREAQELGLKTWLGGGKVMTNKKTWYAHLHKGKKYGRGYFLNKDENNSGNEYCDDFWFNNKWKERKYDLSWLIERFYPVPTWMEDRKQWGSSDKPKDREELAELFAKKNFNVGAEIGVERGLYTETLLKQGLKVYAIDPWKVYKGYREHVSQDKLDKFYEETKKRLEFGDCVVMRMTSAQAVLTFKDESLDFVYIDGNHEFTNVVHDIAQWSKKVRKGGIIAGHDFKRFGGKYGLNSCHVKDVVNAWCSAHKIKFNVTSDNCPSWYYEKV